jgi:hypothetical protein
VKRVTAATSLWFFVTWMDKLNAFQRILLVSLHDISNVLAASLRPLSVVFAVFLFALTAFSLLVMGGFEAIVTDPIFNAGLVASLVFMPLLLVSYWSVMANNNPARQILAFSLIRVIAPNEQSRCAEARRTMRCGAPFFRFR